MGGSAFGPEPPGDRLTALVDILNAKTPAGRLTAIEAGVRAGFVTRAEAMAWMQAPQDEDKWGGLTASQWSQFDDLRREHEAKRGSR